ncbi:glycerol uptake operon antiterminator [Caldalkalibacillus uzonensis]|uniref:Glycerol uptake operon antiterminator regulatory protein n=1 Tax=Caldalkalibacillus uzonensis TaxID=353224 RepID=A0ABU0CNF3_9BACI|nr:glycerol uptake operon antiterminator [Caldalkalibacillus uzonensis]
MNSPIVDMVQSQVIASIHQPELIEEAVDSEANIAFLLTGDLLTIKDYVDRLKSAGMPVFIHLDFIEGLSNHKSAIQYVAREWQPDGIITTRNQLIKAAKEEGLLTIQRIFLLDSSALKRGIELVRACQPDAIEVLPGLMPRVIYELTEELPIPLIAGGLIREKEEILEALRAGALATSVGDPKLWNLDL